MASDWNALEIKIPGKDLLENVRGGLEALILFMDIVKALLETVSLFLIDFGNPIRPLVEALLKLIQQLFNSLKQTGLYGWFDIPNPLQDPNFDRYKGGYQGLVERFKGSLFDGKDPFRPQPIPSIDQSGFVLIVADSKTVFGMLHLMKVLLRFFGKEVLSAKYAAPANVKSFPAGRKAGALAGGSNYDPILQVASVFGAELKGIALEWSLATNQYPPDPGFQDLMGTVSAELIPQYWLIERTSNPQGPILVTQTVTTNFEDKRGKQLSREVRVRDENGDYFHKFEKYTVINPSSETSTFILGQLGTFRYIDTDVEPGKTYKYRIRAYSGPLKVTDGELTLDEPVFDTTRNEYIQRWPSSDSSTSVVMGRPSPLIFGRIPEIPANFDVITCLENTFRMAFALGFHLDLANGSTFDDEGRNTGSTSVTQIGAGSLAGLGGPLSQVIPAVTLGFVNPKSTSLTAGSAGGVAFSTSGAISEVKYDPTTQVYPDVTHNYFSVKSHSARLANAVGSALLENSGQLTPLRDLFYSMPRSIPSKGNLAGVTNLQEMVAGFNKIPSDFPERYYSEPYTTYVAAYSDANTRLNVLDLVRFIKSFTLVGTPPDWISVSLLRDIVPWSGQFLYDLLNRIEALVDAFKSAVDEIKAFIDTLVRKIDTLERFVKYLIEMLNYLDSFSAGFYFLNVPSTGKGIEGWIEAIDTAGGTPPPSGPGGYSAGVALAYSGTNIDAFVKAFSLIF